MQRINIWFCVKITLDLNTTKAGIMKVYQDSSMSESRIAYWYHEFKGGRESILDLPRSSRGKTGTCDDNVKAVQAAIQGDKRSTVTQISVQTGIKRTSVYRILTVNLELVKKCAKFVPCLLTPRNLTTRRDCCEFFLHLIRQFPDVLSSVITILGFVNMTWRPSSSPGSGWQRQSRDPSRNTEAEQLAKSYSFHSLTVLAWCIMSMPGAQWELTFSSKS